MERLIGIRTRQVWQQGVGILAVLAMMMGLVSTNPALAASGTLYAADTTSPGGAIWLGDKLWFSDHIQGFCRLDPDATAPGGFAINQSTCVTDPVSPGQPSFDGTYVYVPNNASKSQEVWRYRFVDGQLETTTARLLSVGAGRPTATAIGPDGSLYIGYLQSSEIRRITDPQAAAPEAATRIASLASGVSALAFAGSDLYLAAEAGVLKVSGLDACSSSAPCAPAAGAISSAVAPGAIASDGSDVLYIADVNEANGTTYFYVVTAVNSGGESDNSNQASAMPTAQAATNLLANPGFELDANANGRPDSWSSNANFTRNNAIAARSGTFVGRHRSTSNVGYSVTQRVNVTAGAAYTFAGWVNIPATSDAFTFDAELVWKNSSNATIGSANVARRYTAATSGWNQFSSTLTAPSGAVAVIVRMDVSSLNATVYVDDWSLTRQ